jgi:hypothetical protein
MAARFKFLPVVSECTGGNKSARRPAVATPVVNMVFRKLVYLHVYWYRCQSDFGNRRVLLAT